MNAEQKMVRKFHKKFGGAIRNKPTAKIPFKEIYLREDLIREEMNETLDALAAGDLIGLADGLGDLLYVVYGTAVACGIDIEPVFRAIHKSNMTKTPAKNKHTKIQKGPNYKPPEIAKALGLK